MNENQDKLPAREQYTAPQIGIIDMEPEQNILSGSLGPIGDGGWL